MALLWRATSQGRVLGLTYARQRALAATSRMISTSKKNKDGIAINVESIKEQQKSEVQKQLEKQFGNADPAAEKVHESCCHDFQFNCSCILFYRGGLFLDYKQLLNVDIDRVCC
jgi:hypothetical protein